MSLLSLEEVLQRSAQRGLEISERTFRYYVVLGLLPKPLKKVGEDARVHFYPAAILDRLQEIRGLQEQGFSLKQIKKYVEEPPPPPELPLLRLLRENKSTARHFRELEGLRKELAPCAARAEEARRRLSETLEQLIKSGRDYAKDPQPESWSRLEEAQERLAQLEKQLESYRA